jgi:aromatic ring-opening dioxygenase LigB subunit
MPLVFAAVAPHSPLLVPNIGKENTAQFTATLAAAEKLSAAFAASGAETIIVLTSKGPAFENCLGINVSPRFKADFDLFGDLVTNWEYAGNIDVCGRLCEDSEAEFPVILTSNSGLDYASAIALSMLGPLGSKTIVPITLGDKISEETALNFGIKLGEMIAAEKQNIAVIAAADLSHRVNKKSPLGYSPKGKKFDQKIVEALKENNQLEFLATASLASTVACEDTGVLAILLGILHDTNIEANEFSYEAPFGVGHLALHYELGPTA